MSATTQWRSWSTLAPPWWLELSCISAKVTAGAIAFNACGFCRAGSHWVPPM